MRLATHRVRTRIAALAALGIAALLAAPALASAPLLPEREPNDKPADAQTVTAPLRFKGELGRRDVDGFTLEVDDDASTQLFGLYVEGPAGDGVTVTVTRDGARSPVATAKTTAKAPYARVERLLLPPGDYRVEVGGGQGAYTVGVSADPLRPVALAEGTPRARAARVRETTDDTAFLLPSGEAWVHWGPRAGRYDLALGVMGDAEVTLSLHDADGGELKRVSGRAPALSGVDVPRGSHYLRLEGPEATLVALSIRRSDEADETPLPPLEVGGVVQAQVTQRTSAAHLLHVDGSAPLYRIAAAGASVKSLTWSTPAGQRLAAVSTTGSGKTAAAIFDGLALPPGDHLFTVDVAPGSYRVAVEALKLPPGTPADAVLEREPNDHTTFADDLRFGATRVGVFSHGQDSDIYRVYAPTEVAARLVVTPSTETLRVRWKVGGNQLKLFTVEPGAPLIFRGRFPAGDHELDVRTYREKEIGTSYGIALSYDDPFDATIVEPNDLPGDARALPADLVARGTGDGVDWWRIPPLAQATKVEITPDVNSRVHLYASGELRKDLVKRTATGFEGDLPAGQPLFLQIGAAGGEAYVAPVRFASGPSPDEAASPAVDVDVRLKQDVAAAYLADLRQTLRGEIRLSPKGAGAVSLTARTTDPRWSVELDQERLTLARGRRVTVPFVVRVAPDARADRPVRIDVGVLPAAAGAPRGSGHATASADGAVPPVGPERVWPLPEALLGGVDVARGGDFVDASGKVLDPGRKLTALVDGVARPDQRFELRLEPGMAVTDMPIIRFRDSRAAKIVGVTLEAVGDDLRESVRDFRVSLSSDGKTWSEVVAATLEAREGEQAFLLAAPQSASFARLEILSSHAGVPATGPGNAYLGTFKVIADPAAPFGPTVDLASEEAGGYLVRRAPGPDHRNLVYLGEGERTEAVYGFHHARAARISELYYVDGGEGGAKANGWAVTFYGSLRGPAGPWTKLGGTTSPNTVVKLDGAPWVRYVKLESSVVDKRARYAAPVLVARERRAGGDYRSILGEWGPFRRQAAYEHANPAPPSLAATAGGNQSKRSAARLGAEPVEGRVHRGQVEDWYAVKMPAGHHQLILRADGQPTLDADFEVTDARGGLVVPHDSEDRAEFSERRYDVSPGKTYYVRVWQPPSSVVFSWDTSGSVAGWVPLVRNAVQRFAETVTPGQERIQLLPFGGGPILTDWEERTQALWTALATYVPSPSSEAEKALQTASTTLGETRGTKAVILLTDALTSVQPGLWDDLTEVQPRVFAAGVAAGLAGVGQDRMESWAAVNAGHYEGVTSRGQLDVFFDRAATWLRRPASYGLRMVTKAEQVAPPGSIEVLGAEKRSAAEDAVEFVVDVSGSMLEKMRGGGTRIEVAKKILAQTVADAVPQGASVGVRVFGRVGGEACGTELAVPVGPTAAVLAAIDGIEAKKYAMTPIAAALEKVADDLAAVKGQKTVVLLTDGRETCGGDPAKVLEQLEAKGLSLRVNVVGFALASKRLKKAFAELAEQGGGAFYDAADGESLAAMLTAAVRAGFTVRDADGAIVARGVVGGDAVTVPAGTYHVDVATTPPMTFESIEVKDGQKRTLQLENLVPED